MTSQYPNIQIAGGDTARPLAMAKRLKVLHPFLESGKRLLDCGCGAGEYVFALAELGIDAHGIEYERDKVRHAHENAKHGHRILEGDIQRLPFADDEWDYVLLNEVLEHVPDDLAAVREAYRVLKTGGVLFIFSPNRCYPFESHGAYTRRSKKLVPLWIPFIPYLPLGISVRFFDYWARNYWPSDLRRLAARGGFRVIATDYVWQTFEGISGTQPQLIRRAKWLLRWVANFGETMPVLRRFGVSQFLACRK